MFTFTCPTSWRPEQLAQIQYDARDKYPSGVVGGRTVIESVAVAASADGESGAKVKRIARKTRAIWCEPLSLEMTLKSH